MDFNPITEWTSEAMRFWNKMDMWDKELSYLENNGIRLVNLRFVYMGIADSEHFKELFDLFYKHKMLVIPHVWGFDQPGFDSLKNPDYNCKVSGDTMGKFTQRLVDMASQYTNIIAFAIENEINYQDVSPESVTGYISFLTGIVKEKLDVPIIHNLAGYPKYSPEVMKAVIEATDIPCYTIYAKDTDELDYRLGVLNDWMISSGFKINYWLLELNDVPDGTAGFDYSFIDKAFEKGANLINLHANHNTGNPAYSFFTMDGTPKEELILLFR